MARDTAPHFTTIAHFVSTLGDDIARVFAAVVAICDAHGLIGRAMFVIDGVKLPSNASKHRSGTRADFARQATMPEATATNPPTCRVEDVVEGSPSVVDTGIQVHGGEHNGISGGSCGFSAVTEESAARDASVIVRMLRTTGGSK